MYRSGTSGFLSTGWASLYTGCGVKAALSFYMNTFHMANLTTPFYRLPGQYLKLGELKHQSSLLRAVKAYPYEEN